MNKNIFKTIFALSLITFSITFTSCTGSANNTIFPIPVLPPSPDTPAPNTPTVSSESIIHISALGLDGKAYVTWANENVSNYTLNLNVNPAPDTGSYPRTLTNEERNNNSLFIEGLQNGTQYTLSLELADFPSTRKTTTVTPSANSVPEHTYNDSTSASSFIELSNGSLAIRIKNASGKFISYANVNTSSNQTISETSLQRFVNVSETGSNQNITIKNGVDVQNITTPLIKHYVQPIDSNGKTIINRSSSDIENFDKTNPQLGQTHFIYTEQDSNFSTYKQELMTLYAIGYEPGSSTNIACLVWAKPEDIITTNSSGSKIKINVIQDIASKFLRYYKFEEQVFGTTCNNLFTSTNSTSSSIDMSNNGPTKNYVNIVLCDIGKDGTNGTCGITGYFDAKDYYTATTVNYSNEGKYLYIDIPFCNYKKIGYDVNYDGNDNTASDTSIASLFHEYRHMITFNQKNINAGLNSVDTWYNEMLSILGEDLFGDTLGLEYGAKVYDMSIPVFNGYYYNSGVNQYNKNYPWISEAVSYAFGSFLLRNYGGIRLVREISTNNTQGIESIVAAVNTVNSTNYSWNDIFKEYIKASAFRAGYAKEKDLPTHNKTRTGSTWIEDLIIGNSSVAIQNNTYNVTGGTLSTSVRGLNLWYRDYGNYNSAGTQQYYGPLLLNFDAKLDLQPQGFILHSIGLANSNDILLFFTDPVTSNQKLYIFIQDDFNMTSYDSTAAEVIN